MTKDISYHAQVERKARIDWIIDTLKGNFGVEVCSVCDSHNNTRRTLMDTGLIVITDKDSNRLVTMYFGNVSQITQLYRTALNIAMCPKHIMKIAYRCAEYVEQQF